WRRKLLVEENMRRRLSLLARIRGRRAFEGRAEILRFQDLPHLLRRRRRNLAGVRVSLQNGPAKDFLVETVRLHFEAKLRCITLNAVAHVGNVIARKRSPIVVDEGLE